MDNTFFILLIPILFVQFSSQISAVGKLQCSYFSVIQFLLWSMILIKSCFSIQEVLVRFVGFGPEDDEWVNIRKHVRQRSLPCESSECVAVLPGDLILCFQVETYF